MAPEDEGVLGAPSGAPEDSPAPSEMPLAPPEDSPALAEPMEQEDEGSLGAHAGAAGGWAHTGAGHAN